MTTASPDDRWLYLRPEETDILVARYAVETARRLGIPQVIEEAEIAYARAHLALIKIIRST